VPLDVTSATDPSTAPGSVIDGPVPNPEPISTMAVLLGAMNVACRLETSVPLRVYEEFPTYSGTSPSFRTETLTAPTTCPDHAGSVFSAAPTSGEQLRQTGVVEGLVNDALSRRVEIRLDRLEGRPATDGHHDAGVDALVDEEPLGEAPPEVVTRDVAEVVVAGSISSCLGGASDDRPDAAGGEIDERVVVFEALITSELIEIAFEVAGEVGVPWLALAVFRVLPLGNPESVVLAVVDATNVVGLDLGDLEGPEADEPAELDDEVVASRGRGSPQRLEVVVGEPDFEPALGSLFAHTICSEKAVQVSSYLTGK